MKERLQNNEHTQNNTALEVFEAISKHEPKPIAAFVPDNADEQRMLFLSDEVRNPVHTYSKLAALEPEATSDDIARLASRFDMLLDNSSTEYMAYSQYAVRARLGHELLSVAQDIHSDDSTISAVAREQYRMVNEKMYGAPDEATYRSLLGEAVNTAKSGDVDQVLLSELAVLAPEVGDSAGRFTPSEETVQFMQGVAEYLYGGMLSHIPQDKKSFSPVEIAEVFRTILHSEFDGVADEWRVEAVKAASINVVASEKLIKIPENRAHVTYSQLRGLVAHELGVHMLRSLMGESTDLAVLKTGLSDYYDSEEGLGKVMEQAVNGAYQDSGVDYYIITGLMYFDNKDFRDTFEIMWRLKYLKTSTSEGRDDKAVKKAREDAYKAVLRISRGTDTEPFLKDLAYYNGASKVWEYAENHCGDYEHISLLTLGKADPANDSHRRIILETHSL